MWSPGGDVDRHDLAPCVARTPSHSAEPNVAGAAGDHDALALEPEPVLTRTSS